jgi:uncharacterized protein DUF2267
MGQASPSRAQAGYFFGDDWRYERFVTTIEQKAGISWAEAERAARATLHTLAERLSGPQARELAAELPAPLGDWLSNSGPRPERFDADEFVRRVAARAHWIPSAPRGTCGRCSSPWPGSFAARRSRA